MLPVAILALCLAHADEPTPTLSMDALVEAFRAHSPTLAQLDARTSEAAAQIKLAMAAALPVLAAQGGYVRNNAAATVNIQSVFDKLGSKLPFQLDTSSLPGPMIIQPLERWSGGAQLTVPLVAPAAWAGVSAARAAREATDASVEAARRSAENALIHAAWATGLTVEATALAQHAESVAQRHEQAVARRVEAGLATDLDRLAAQTATLARASALVQARADQARAERALGTLIGQDAPVGVALPDPAAGDDAATGHGTRPERIAAAAQVIAAKRQTTAAWLRHAPTLNAEAGAIATNVPYPTGLKYGWHVGVQLTWVIFDGGARYAALQQAHASKTMAEASARATDLAVSQQTHDAAAAVETARSRLSLANATLTTADLAEAAAARAYEAGLITSVEVLDAQQRRLEAGLALASARAQLGMAQADLRFATGS